VIAYFDSSAVAKLVASDEADAGTAARLWDDAEAIVSSSIVHAETHAALAAMVRATRLTRARGAAARNALDDYLAEVDTVTADDALCRRAGHLAGRLALRGADAIHLASALAFGGDSALVLVSWDAQLSEAAATAGLATAGI